MKSKITALILITLSAITLAVPALAGGWATITLDEFPSGVTAGEALTIRFSVRQHGKTLMEGLTPTVSAIYPQDGTSMIAEASPVQGKTGVYQASLTFPNPGTWVWSIQAFTMDQRMPDLVVSAGTPSLSAQSNLNFRSPVVIGTAGMALGLAALGVFLRQKKSWSIALLILGLFVGVFGFASASNGKNNPDQNADAKQAASAVEIGEALFVAKGCVTCHSNENIGNKYYEFHLDAGPNLTNYAASAEYLRTWLKDPAAIRPDAEMPNLELSEVEIEALIAFLTSSGSQGESPDEFSPAIAAPPGAESSGQKTATDKESCSELDYRQALLVSYSRETDGYISLVDPSTGAPLCNALPIESGNSPEFFFTPDRSAAAVLSADSYSHTKWSLQWIDLRSWKASDREITLDGWSTGLAINPQRTHIAVAYAQLSQDSDQRLLGYRLVQVDTRTMSMPLEIELDVFPSLVGYSVDGRSILVYGSSYDYLVGTNTSDAKIRLYNALDLNLIWQTELEGVLQGTYKTGEVDNNDPNQYTMWEPALALAENGNKLFIVHADADQLTTVDLLNYSTSSVDIKPRMGWFERLLVFTAGEAHAKVLNGTTKLAAISPDGTQLYVTGFTGLPSKDERGDWQFEILPLGLQVVDTTNGIELGRINSKATDVDISIDGETLFLRTWNENESWTDILDARSLEVVAHLEDQLLYAAQTLDGKVLVVGGPEGQWARILNIYEQTKLSVLNMLSGNGYWVSTP
jgi:mono/diheme cytochrome c family protein